MVKQLETIEEFDATIKSGQLIVIDFTATWCGPCRFIGPKFESMSKEFTGATFVKVDVDENQEASTRCKVRCMPTFQLYKDGKKVGQMEGANEAELRKLVTKHGNGLLCNLMTMMMDQNIILQQYVEREEVVRR